jgi:hypothetical protein
MINQRLIETKPLVEFLIEHPHVLVGIHRSIPDGNGTVIKRFVFHSCDSKGKINENDVFSLIFDEAVDE